MSKLFLKLALTIFSLVLAEGTVLLVLYLTEPPSDGLGRVLHFEVMGGILASIAGYIVTPILTFILYLLIKKKAWFIKLQEKPWHSFTILLIMIIVASAPIVGYVEHKKWREYQKYQQNLTPEDMIIRWFPYPAGINPTMKDVSIKKENGDVHLYMEYDEHERWKRSRSEFQEDLLHYIWSQTLIMTPYKELKTLSVQVRYENEWYEFDRIPLKNEVGKPFKDIEDDNEIISILRDKMKITPSIEREETR